MNLNNFYKMRGITRQMIIEAIGSNSNWTARASLPTASYYTAPCWSPELGLFITTRKVTPAAQYCVYKSSDGITWATSYQNSGGSTMSCNVSCWSPELGLFVVGPSVTSGIATSPDATNWTAQTAAFTPTSICWSPELGKFCAVTTSNGTASAYTSTNGVTWTPQSSTLPLNTLWSSVCWAAELGIFVAAKGSTSTSSIYTSPDGITWTARTTPNATIDALCWAPELGMLLFTSYTGTAGFYASTDGGVTWNSIASNTIGVTSVLSWYPEMGMFAMGGNTSVNIYSSFDGVTWTGRILGISGFTPYGFAYSPELGIFIATGYSLAGACSYTSKM